MRRVLDFLLYLFMRFVLYFRLLNTSYFVVNGDGVMLHTTNSRVLGSIPSLHRDVVVFISPGVTIFVIGNFYVWLEFSFLVFCNLNNFTSWADHIVTDCRLCNWIF